jgi:hypothetical protein
MHLFKEMLCDKSMNGVKLPANLELLAACNPYRRKPGNMERAQGLERTADGEAGAADANLVYAVELARGGTVIICISFHWQFLAVTS